MNHFTWYQDALWLAKVLGEVYSLWLARRVGAVLFGFLGFSLFKTGVLMCVYLQDGAYAEWFWLLQILENMIIAWLCLDLAGIKSWVQSILFALVVFCMIFSGPPSDTYTMLSESQIIQCLCAIALLGFSKTPNSKEKISYSVLWIVGLQIVCGTVQVGVGLNQFTRTLWQVSWMAGIGILINALYRYQAKPLSSQYQRAAGK